MIKIAVVDDEIEFVESLINKICLLYTSDAADDSSVV